MELPIPDVSIPTPNFNFFNSKDFSVRRRSSNFSQSILYNSIGSNQKECDLNNDFPCKHIFESTNVENSLQAMCNLSFASDCTIDDTLHNSLSWDSDVILNSKVMSDSFLRDDLKLVKKIGEGSFGTVFCVNNPKTYSLFAVKIIKNKIGHFSSRCELLKEANNHSYIGFHINFVRLYSVWEHELHICMQFELCSSSLKELIISKGPIISPQIWWVLKDIVNGILYLHDRNFIHLDLKPANLFLSIDFKSVKIGDLGLLYNLSDPTNLAVEGDNRYMAPELLSKLFGKPADIFSLGLTVLELLTNMHIPSEGHLWHKLRQERFPSVFLKLPNDLKKLILMMLRTDPDKRLCVNQLYTVTYNCFLKHQSSIVSKYSQCKIIHLVCLCFSALVYFISIYLHWDRPRKFLDFPKSFDTANSLVSFSNSFKNQTKYPHSCFSPFPHHYNSKPFQIHSSLDLASTAKGSSIMNYGLLRNRSKEHFIQSPQHNSKFFDGNSENISKNSLYRHKFSYYSCLNKSKMPPRRLNFD